MNARRRSCWLVCTFGCACALWLGMIAPARAADARLWSLAPVVEPPLPAVQQTAWPRNAVDAFILARLEADGFIPAPPAPPEHLVRRLYFDLWGLPPDPQVVARFVVDPSDAAYERLVDELLADARFGERWGRFWLDVVRFAETNGYERDAPKPNAWKYRDWVVSALNRDLPYDQFVTWQLAGDEVPQARDETRVATGFLRVGTFDDEPNDPLQYQFEQLDDLMHATGTAFLALTIKCARCHDHKYDPIPQRDYYALLNAFIGGQKLDGDFLTYTDSGPQVAEVRLLEKGDPRRPADVVPPGYLSLLPELARAVQPPPPGAATTTRRWQLAQWIVDPRHPLTPRVAVNRLWQGHFGQGLVRTPDNFGSTGALPTHPELLDWLAHDLVAHDWTLKRLHKLLVLSSTYRMSSTHPSEAEYLERDFDNLHFWKMNRRRIEAEALRDAMLAVSGELDLRLGGPSFTLDVSSAALEGLSRKDAAWQPSPPEEQRRRSLYMLSQRSLIAPLLTTFDFADTTQPVCQRNVSTVAPQALALLNNEFVHDRSQALAVRVAAEAGPDEAAQIARAWELALGRRPSATEVALARAHLAEQRLRFEQAAEPPAALDENLPVTEGLALWLSASRGVECDADGSVSAWRDQGPHAHDAQQPLAAAQPRLVPSALGGQPALGFDGANDFLHVAGQVLDNQQFTICALAQSQGGAGHREIFSNWDGAAGNVGTSIFFGLTTNEALRLSDDFAPAGSVPADGRPLLLVALSRPEEAAVYLGHELLASRSRGLAERNLGAPYVVGQQGNIQGEYWHGLLAELLVFNRALSADERALLTDWLAAQYGLALRQPLDPAQQALASLCHVLLNVNEFVYVD